MAGVLAPRCATSRVSSRPLWSSRSTAPSCAHQRGVGGSVPGPDRPPACTPTARPAAARAVIGLMAHKYSDTLARQAIRDQGDQRMRYPGDIDDLRSELADEPPCTARSTSCGPELTPRRCRPVSRNRSSSTSPTTSGPRSGGISPDRGRRPTFPCSTSSPSCSVRSGVRAGGRRPADSRTPGRPRRSTMPRSWSEAWSRTTRSSCPCSRPRRS